MCDQIFTGNMGKIHTRGHRISAFKKPSEESKV